MIVGLHGRAGSGKDTSFDYMSEWVADHRRPLTARRSAFADKLKVSAARAIGYDGDPQECIDICNRLKQPGWNIVVIESGGKIEHPISGREYLQRYGTEAHRDVFGEDFWIDAALEGHHDQEILVVTDVRFESEAQAILDRGGQVWHLKRPVYSIPEDHHASEQPLPDKYINAVIDNNADLRYLRRQVRAQCRRSIDK